MKYPIRWFALTTVTIVSILLLENIANTTRKVTWVNIATGDVEERMCVFSERVISTHARTTSFAIEARRLGIVTPATPNNWRANSVKYKFSSKTENLQYGGTLQSFETIASWWELTKTPDAQRTEQLRKIFDLLQSGRRFRIKIADDDTLTIEPQN